MNEKQRAKLINAYLVGAITEEEFMAHAGIPGMRWGYTRSKLNGGRVAKNFEKTTLAQRKTLRGKAEEVAKSQKAFDREFGKKVSKAMNSDNVAESMKEVTKELQTQLNSLKGKELKTARANVLNYTRLRAKDMSEKYNEAKAKDKSKMEDAIIELANVAGTAIDSRTGKQKVADAALTFFTPVGGIKEAIRLAGTVSVMKTADKNQNLIDEWGDYKY